jgi:hypothetical protein
MKVLMMTGHLRFPLGIKEPSAAVFVMITVFCYSYCCSYILIIKVKESNTKVAEYTSFPFQVFQKAES